MVTPSDTEQKPGYSRITIGSVSFNGSGFELTLDEVGDYNVSFSDVPVTPGSVRNDLDDGSVEVFVIGIHSVDDGPAGVGSGEVGDPSSLIGIKVLETGTSTDVSIPIFPVKNRTDVRLPSGDGDDPATPPQVFPPIGDSDIQAALYTSDIFQNPMPDPVATTDVVTVTNGLDQNDDRGPLKPTPGGALEESQLVTVELTNSGDEPVEIFALTVGDTTVISIPTPLGDRPDDTIPPSDDLDDPDGLPIPPGETVPFPDVPVAADEDEVDILVLKAGRPPTPRQETKDIPDDGVIGLTLDPADPDSQFTVTEFTVEPPEKPKTREPFSRRVSAIVGVADGDNDISDVRLVTDEGTQVGGSFELSKSEIQLLESTASIFGEVGDEPVDINLEASAEGSSEFVELATKTISPTPSDRFFVSPFEIERRSSIRREVNVGINDVDGDDDLTDLRLRAVSDDESSITVEKETPFGSTSDSLYIDFAQLTASQLGTSAGQLFVDAKDQDSDDYVTLASRPVSFPINRFSIDSFVISTPDEGPQSTKTIKGGVQDHDGDSDVTSLRLRAIDGFGENKQTVKSGISSTSPVTMSVSESLGSNLRVILEAKDENSDEYVALYNTPLRSIDDNEEATDRIQLDRFGFEPDDDTTSVFATVSDADGDDDITEARIDGGLWRSTGSLERENTNSGGRATFDLSVGIGAATPFSAQLDVADEDSGEQFELERISVTGGPVL